MGLYLLTVHVCLNYRLPSKIISIKDPSKRADCVAACGIAWSQRTQRTQLQSGSIRGSWGCRQSMSPVVDVIRRRNQKPSDMLARLAGRLRLSFHEYLPISAFSSALLSSAGWRIGRRDDGNIRGDRYWPAGIQNCSITFIVYRLR